MNALQSECKENKPADNTSHLLQQLDLIRQRQQQLHDMQIHLQAQLEQQSDTKQQQQAILPNQQPAGTPLRYDNSQNYEDFVAANVEDISPLTTTSSPDHHLQSEGILSGADVYSPFNTMQKQTFFPRVTADEEDEDGSKPDHDQVVPLTKSNMPSKSTPQPISLTQAYPPYPYSPLSPCPAIYSPKAVMSGSAQLLQPATDFISPLPIQTPLALRNMAVSGSSHTADTNIWDISFTPEDSPVASNESIPPPPKIPTTPASARTGTPHNQQQQTPKRGGEVMSTSIPTNTLTFSTRSTPLLAAHTAHTAQTITSILSPAAYSSHITPTRMHSASQPYHTCITPLKQTRAHSAHLCTLSSPRTPRLSTPLSLLSQSTPQRLKAPSTPAGSLSLAAHLPAAKHSSPISLRSTALSNAVSRFYDALLDDEVALYACRIKPNSPAKLLSRIQDPVAGTLLYGDEMVYILHLCV